MPLIYVVTPLGLVSSMGTPTACRVTAHPPPPTHPMAQPLGAWHMEAAMCSVGKDS